VWEIGKKKKYNTNERRKGKRLNGFSLRRRRTKKKGKVKGDNK
jgi:hypothetical protein